eukprot:scaffold12.g8016.t1
MGRPGRGWPAAAQRSGWSTSAALVALLLALCVGGARAATWTATVAAPVAGTGTTYDVDCPCGFVTGFEVFAHPDTGGVADIRIQCSGDAAAYISGPAGSLTFGAGVTPAYMAVLGGSSAAGFSAVGATASGTAITAFSPTGGQLDCGGGFVVGLQLEALPQGPHATQQLISIKAACDAKDAVACSGAPPSSCQPGHTLDANSQQCEPCLPGTQEVDGSCEYCPAGTHQSEPGRTTCEACAPGTFAASEGADVCSPAPAGAVASAGATEPTWCEAGTVSNAAHTQCVDCPPGYWRPGGLASPASNACQRVPAGWRALSATKASEAEMCPAGSVSSWGGSSEVLVWAPGVAPAAARAPADPTACKPCAGSTFAALPGSTLCSFCRAGFAPNGGHTACVACPPLTYKPYGDAGDACLKCGPGLETGFKTGAQTCSPCEPGYVNPAQTAAGNSSQFPGIDARTYFSSPPDGDLGVSTTCLACPKNWYQDQSGGAECKRCPAGSSTDGPGSDTCDACPIGTYSPSADTPCLLAPAGTFVGTTGAAATTDCRKGTFASSSGSDACDACPAGTFAPQDGSVACTKCPAGTWSKAGSESCLPCSPGTYSVAGARQCLPCRAGTFAKNGGQGSCTPAPAGSFVAGAGAQRPTPCPKGSFQPKTGKPTCTKCPVNTYQSLTGKTTCSACCGTGTALGSTCWQSTRGATGQAKCQRMRVLTGKLRLLR